MPKTPSTQYHEAEVIVRAGSVFPLDMLRYDSCWPSRSQDVGELAETLSVEGRKLQREAGGVVRIHVARTTPHKCNSVWTIERWRSFGVVLKPRCACCRHQWVEPKPQSVAVPPHVPADRDKPPCEVCRSGSVGGADTCPSCGRSCTSARIARASRRLTREREAGEPVCTACEKPGSQCGCKPAGTFV
jgi:hypothetical protein